MFAGLNFNISELVYCRLARLLAALNSEKLAAVVHGLRTQNCWPFHVVVLRSPMYMPPLEGGKH